MRQMQIDESEGHDNGTAHHDPGTVDRGNVQLAITQGAVQDRGDQY